MSRTRILHSPLAHLALIAMLLMALLPTIGRLVQAQAQPQPDGIGAYWTAMCTSTGMAMSNPVAVSSAHALSSHDMPAPTPSRGHFGMDCDYCPLLAGLVVLAVCMLLALVQLALAPRPPRAATAVFATPHPCGLGSRGPPLAA